jgi:hypothetical protein
MVSLDFGELFDESWMSDIKTPKTAKGRSSSGMKAAFDEIARGFG